MAKKYNIIERLQAKREKPFIQITDELVFEVDTGKTASLHLMAVGEDEDLNEFERIDKMIEIAFGKKAAKEIDELDLPTPALMVLVEAISAAMSGEELEEARERFQEE